MTTYMTLTRQVREVLERPLTPEEYRTIMKAYINGVYDVDVIVKQIKGEK